MMLTNSKASCECLTNLGIDTKSMNSYFEKYDSYKNVGSQQNEKLEGNCFYISIGCCIFAIKSDTLF